MKLEGEHNGRVIPAEMAAFALANAKFFRRLARNPKAGRPSFLETAPVSFLKSHMRGWAQIWKFYACE